MQVLTLRHMARKIAGSPARPHLALSQDAEFPQSQADAATFACRRCAERQPRFLVIEEAFKRRR